MAQSSAKRRGDPGARRLACRLQQLPLMRRTPLLVGTLLLTTATCANPSGPGGAAGSGDGPSGDGFAVGRQPLELLPAAPGLCLGSGADKECADPNGCEATTEGADGAPSTGTGAGGTSSYPAGTGGAYLSAMGGSYDLGSLGGMSSTGGITSVEPESSSAGSEETDEPTAAAGESASGAAGATAGAAGTSPSAGAGPLAGAATESEAGAAGAGVAGATASTPAEGPGLRPRAEPAACSALDRTEPATLYLSADDSNSTASPVIARRLIRSGQRVLPSLVRSWEFLNYYDFAFEAADRGAVRIVPQLSACPVDGELSFQVALQAEARDPEGRAPLTVTFVLDTSGSMSGSPIELERAAVRAIAGELLQGDVVSMVTWSVDQADILTAHEVAGPDDPTLLAAADALSPSGGTDLAAGLRRGYTLARASYAPDRINRVVLISDGQANVGVTDEELIGEAADDEEGDAGIYLTGIGVGAGVNDTLMNVVTDRGRGAYVYLDSAAEAQKMLGDRFLQVVDLAARAVRLEMTLPWYMAVAKFYGEQISIDPTQVRPQHLGPNDAMLFFQILHACDASLVHGDDRIRLRATWEEPFTRRAREAVVDATLNELAGDDTQLAKAAAVAGYAEALVEAHGLTGRERAAVLTEALDAVEAAAEASPDPDLEEIAALLTAYREQG